MSAPHENITTMEDMRDYIKLMLGFPVINVELSNNQIYQVIYDAAQIFWRYGYDEANYRDHAILNLTSGTDEYSLSGTDIINVVDFDFSFGVDGINTLFSPTHTLLYKDWVVRGNYPGGPGVQGLVLTDWAIGMNYLEEIRNTFGKMYTAYYRPLTETLKIFPTPKEDITGVLIVYKKMAMASLYNHVLFKELCVAKAKKLWGFNINKTNITLPGGGTINGAEIKAEGKEEEKEAIDKLRSESSPIDFLIG
ncbi:MAG TPA: hypothetical protein PLI22_04730 [Caldisericia bacterium]|nr:hypothetical protein [Caldisericia bacterium]